MHGIGPSAAEGLEIETLLMVSTFRRHKAREVQDREPRTSKPLNPKAPKPLSPRPLNSFTHARRGPVRKRDELHHASTGGKTQSPVVAMACKEGNYEYHQDPRTGPVCAAVDV